MEGTINTVTKFKTVGAIALAALTVSLATATANPASAAPAAAKPAAAKPAANKPAANKPAATAVRPGTKGPSISQAGRRQAAANKVAAKRAAARFAANARAAAKRATPGHAAEKRTAGSPRTTDPATSDTTLSSLGTGGFVTPIAPSFDPVGHDYQAVADDTSPITVTASTTDGNATVVVAENGTTYPRVSGTATVPLIRGRNVITVTVTSSDATATAVYRLTVWRLASPVSRITGLDDAHSTVYGGSRMTVTLADGALPQNCYRFYSIGGNFGNIRSSNLDPATGLTKEVVSLPDATDLAAGRADLALVNYCYLPGGTEVQAVTVSSNAVTYTAGYPITSADIPATVTSGSAMVLHGTDINEDSDAWYWMEDAAGNQEEMQSWDFTGNNSTTLYPDYAYGDVWYQGSGPRTLHVGYCPDDEVDNTCQTLFTAPVNWAAPVPSNVSFSPSSGSVAGGTVVRLRGRFVLSGTEDLILKVGDQIVTDWNTISEADSEDNYSSFLAYTQGQDVLEFAAPPSATTGPVAITVTNESGTAVARGTFTYSARPTIASITPATVANSGGSVITVNGTAFGTAGRPTVVIDGVKSPYVTRSSATRLTAVVPASTSTGAVDVSVSSPQGGGVSSAATLTLTAPTTLPTITAITPAAGRVSDDVTLTGTGFGAVGTVGVSVDGDWALVTASTATSITFEVPTTDTVGLKDVVVGSTTGTVTRTNGFRVVPDDGITAVNPATVASYATGSAARITVDGAGFGSSGTVKVGSAAAVAYTATAAGTHIAGVAVPTTVAGSLPIVVTPTGAAAPLRSTVRVTAPVISYVGPNPYLAAYGPPNLDTGVGGLVLGVPTTGGSAMRLQGTGFGPTGSLKFGTAIIRTTTWTDTVITFVAPAHAVGVVGLTVTPTHSTLTVSQSAAANYVPAPAALPTISRVASVVDYSHPDRNEFDPPNDLSNAFTLTGTNLAGTDSTATRIIISDNSQSFTIVPTAVTATSFTFAAPRGFTDAGWKYIEIDTNLGLQLVTFGMYYLNPGAQITRSPITGLCLRTTTPATGSVSYAPAVVTINASGELFGASGTVTMDGVAFTPTSYAAGQIVVSMASLASNLAQPWGGKSIVITPTDPTLAVQSVGFTCGVTPSVATTANGNTDPLTVAAGTSYTPGFTTAGFVGANPFTVAAPGGYEYVSAAVYGSTGFQTGVKAGVPLAAGDYYLRVALSRATYAAERYLPFTPAPVHVTITGTPITITPVSDHGSSFPYRGQLTDGTGSSPTDFHYTNTTVADPITGVTWEYRDSVCESQADTAGWTSGLPKHVATSSTSCGGDGVTRSSWDVRVRSFSMSTSGTDRSVYYDATLPTTQITITPGTLTIAAVRADRVYDGTTDAVFGDLTVTGAVEGDDVTLAGGSTGTFADPAPGVNKPVTLSNDLALSGSAATDYVLTNPRPTIVGTITKASAVLSLAASTTSVLLSEGTPVTITPTVTDSRTGQPVADDANAAPVVLTSQTPTICTISGTTVTAQAAGTCVIAGTEAASVNYTSATAASDPTSTTETIEIQVFPAPQTISVVADDITMTVGDDLNPTSQVSGLFDGDSVDGIDYDYYSGSTLLTDLPSAPGTYRVVPKDGTLTAANPSAYSNPTSFVYVAGTLVITALPPTITTISPDTGPTTGGTRVTITGTRLDTVRSVRIGAVTLRAGDFSVNQAGTSLTFSTPRVASPRTVDLILVNGTATASDLYTYTAPVITAPGAPTGVNAVGHDQTIKVTFTPPVSNGGSPITSYQISIDGGRTWHTAKTKAGPGGTLTATVTGVTNDVTYSVMVRAVNSVGAGSDSRADAAKPRNDLTTPGAPTKVKAAGRNHKIKVRFTPPASDGGSAITSYKFKIKAGHKWHTVKTKKGSHSTRTATLTGVKNGIHYKVRVRAVNDQGAGRASKSNGALPNAPALGTVRHHPASEVAIPKHPEDYHGQKVFTRARNTSHNGTWAHPISKIGARQLTVGEAATLSKSSLFDFDSHHLTKAGHRAVKLLAGHLRLAHGVSCEGYTDYAGLASHEKELSRGRAEVVCKWLVRYGANVDTTTHGYGGARPVVIGGSAVSRASNRRVVVIVTS